MHSGVAVIIPTYNEVKNIEAIVRRVRGVLPQARIVVADDNSPDGTGGVVLTLSKKIHNVALLSRPGKDGLGRAYLYAFAEVCKDPSVTHVVMMDADFSHD